VVGHIRTLRIDDRIRSVGNTDDTVQWTTDTAEETSSQSDYFRLGVTNSE